MWPSAMGGGGAGRIPASQPRSRSGKRWGTTTCSPRAWEWPELGRRSCRSGRTATADGGSRGGSGSGEGRAQGWQSVMWGGATGSKETTHACGGPGASEAAATAAREDDGSGVGRREEVGKRLNRGEGRPSRGDDDVMPTRVGRRGWTAGPTGARPPAHGVGADSSASRGAGGLRSCKAWGCGRPRAEGASGGARARRRGAMSRPAHFQFAEP
jgi:hypothetical protein